MHARRATLLLLAVLLAPVLAEPALAQERLVPQSLWGVRASVGLGPLAELVTNHGGRSFWQERPTGEGVRVAIIDTGLDPTHPDLRGALACPSCWLDLVNGRARPYDDHGHGTHVAGIVAGRGHLQLNPLNSYFPTGARGLAPGAGLLVAKAMNASGSGSDERVGRAIDWALDPDRDPATNDGAHIIHLSLGIEEGDAFEPGSETEAAARRAIEAGVLVVLSAGNQAVERVPPPGNVEGVITVGAADANGNILSFSNRGPEVDLYAPGVVMSTWPAALDDDGIEDGYTGLAGTSQAAPVVTGALALAMGANPALLEGGGATKVAHLEATLRRVGQPTADGSSVTLDAAALLAVEDEGTSAVAWAVVAPLAALALIVLLVVLRATVRMIGGRREEEQAAPAGSKGWERVEREAAPDEGVSVVWSDDQAAGEDDPLKRGPR